MQSCRSVILHEDNYKDYPKNNEQGIANEECDTIAIQDPFSRQGNHDEHKCSGGFADCFLPPKHPCHLQIPLTLFATQDERGTQ